MMVNADSRTAAMEYWTALMTRSGMSVPPVMDSALKLLKAGGNTAGGEGAEGGVDVS